MAEKPAPKTTQIQVPKEIEIRFTDNQIFRLGISFVLSHYYKTKNISPAERPAVANKLLSEPQLIINFAIESFSWGEIVQHASAIQNEIMPDYETEWKDPENKRIICQTIEAEAPKIAHSEPIPPHDPEYIKTPKTLKTEPENTANKELENKPKTAKKTGAKKHTKKALKNDENAQ